MTPELTDAEIRQSLRDREERTRRELRAAAKLAKQFDGCSLAAVILAVRACSAFSVDWLQIVRQAKLKRLDIEEMSITRKLEHARHARAKGSKMLEAHQNAALAPRHRLEGWDAYLRAEKRKDALWERQEAIWREREELMK